MPDSLPWDQFTNDNPVTTESAEPIVVVGAGLAGCWMARTLAELGISVIVLDAQATPARGSSSNPAGIVKPFVTRCPSLAMSFHVEAHSYLLEKLRNWNLIDACEYNACGVIQLVEKPYPASAHYRCLLPDQVRQLSGNSIASHGLLFEQSGWLNPAKLCHALLQHSLIEVRCHCRVGGVEKSSDSHWKIDIDGQPSLLTSHLVLGSGAQLTELPLTCELPITLARGQISRISNTVELANIRHVISGKHYFIPDGDTMIVGATFKRDHCEDSIKPEDDLSNLEGLNAMVPELQNQPTIVDAYAGVRATTTDRLPLVGPVPDIIACRKVYSDLHHGRNITRYPALPEHEGAYVLGGLGSRGIVTAPFAAGLLANLMLGGNDIATWAPLLNPARFQIRSLKRQ